MLDHFRSPLSSFVQLNWTLEHLFLWRGLFGSVWKPSETSSVKQTVAWSVWKRGWSLVWTLICTKHCKCIIILSFPVVANVEENEHQGTNSRIFWNMGGREHLENCWKMFTRTQRCSNFSVREWSEKDLIQLLSSIALKLKLKLH